MIKKKYQMKFGNTDYDDHDIRDNEDDDVDDDNDDDGFGDDYEMR